MVDITFTRFCGEKDGENWQVNFHFSHQWIHILDHKDKRSCFIQGDDSDEHLLKIDELGCCDYLDWFFLIGYDLLLNNENYEQDMKDDDWLSEIRRKVSTENPLHKIGGIKYV